MQSPFIPFHNFVNIKFPTAGHIVNYLKTRDVSYRNHLATLWKNLS